MWDKMRAIVPKAAFQKVLRNCSTEAMGEGQYTCDFGEEGIHAVMRISFQKISASLLKLFLLVIRNSRRREGF